MNKVALIKIGIINCVTGKVIKEKTVDSELALREGEKMKPDPLDDKEMREAITRIVRKYDVHLVSLTRNIQWTLDVELDSNIYYKEQEKMEEEIRTLGNINDIFYRDIT